VIQIRTAIFGDVHGNLPALEAFVEATQGEVDDYLCLGDLINYGPWSNECVDLVGTLPGVQIVRGNHEELFLAPHKVALEIPLVKLFFEANFRNFDRYDQISIYQPSLTFAHFTACHTIDDLRIFPDTKIQLDKNWLIGHSHHQFSYSNSGYTLVNPGSVGQNRKFINLVEFAIFDHETKEFSFHSKKYEVNKVISEMISRKFPKECIDYYTAKQRY
jgi:predicted phosphodiesterase